MRTRRTALPAAALLVLATAARAQAGFPVEHLPTEPIQYRGGWPVDVDLDGFTDLVLFGLTPDGYVVFRSKAPSGFEPFQVSPVPKHKSNDAPPGFADFDEDGKLDIAWEEYDMKVRVMLGDGAGTFGSLATFVTGQDPRGAAAGDLTGDGHADVITIHGSTDEFSLLAGDGQGGFAFPVTLPGRSSVWGPRLGDLDGNGTLDLVARGVSKADVTVALLDGAGGVTSTAAVPVGFASDPWIELADMDGDGTLDVVTNTSNSLVVLLGDGAGTFGTAFTASGFARVGNVAVADMDGDGWPDVTAALGDDFTGSNVYMQVFRNRWGEGASGLALHRLVVDSGGRSHAMPVDFDRDGVMDLASVSYEGVDLYRVLAPGAVTGPKTLGPTLGWKSGILLAGDFAGDPLPDLVVADGNADFGSPGPIRLVRNDGGSFTLTATTAPYLTTDVAAGDVDADGDLDVVITRRDQNDALVLLGDGAGGLAPGGSALVGQLNPRRLAMGHFDGDAYMDVVTVGANSARLLLSDGNGGFQAQSFGYGFSNSWPYDVAVGHLDPDGHLDAACTIASTSDLKVHVLRGNGAGQLAAGPFLAVPPGTYPVGPLAVGDLDGDGHDDVVVTVDLLNSTTYTIHACAWLADGAGGFGPCISSVSGSAVSDQGRELDLGDYDGDGNLDLMLANGVLLAGQGDGSFVQALHVGIASNQSRVAGGDFDGDGRRDVVLGGYPNVHLNLGASCGAVPYCQAKTNSLGCNPVIGATGEHSAASAAGFTVTCANARNGKPGTLIYSTAGALNAPFGGGRLCISPPVRRTLGLVAGGSAPPAQDCTGTYALDMSAFAHGLLGGNPDPLLTVPGTELHAQWWMRDQGFAPPENVGLSNGLRWAVCP